MQGFTTLDLAKTLGDAHRDELAQALRTRPGPGGGIRSAVGRSLVQTGLRLMGKPTMRIPTASSA